MACDFFDVAQCAQVFKDLCQVHAVGDIDDGVNVYAIEVCDGCNGFDVGACFADFAGDFGEQATVVFGHDLNGDRKVVDQVGAHIPFQ